MKDRTCYVIIGETGQYSARNDWVLRDRTDKEKAELRHSMCQRMADEIEEKLKETGKEFWQFGGLTDEQKKIDEGFHIDYTGTTYYVVETLIDPNP